MTMRSLFDLLDSIVDTLVVWDTEFTAWPGSQARGWSGSGEYRELVQIGAVALDAHEGFREIGAFERIVRPKINPQVSDYFVDLTGISQARIDREGIAFPEAANAFTRFVSPWRGAIGSFGRDDAVFAENCALNNIAVPITSSRFCDLRPLLEEALGVTGVMSSDLPRVVGLQAPLNAHDALDDARAIATVIRHLLRRKNEKRPYISE